MLGFGEGFSPGDTAFNMQDDLVERAGPYAATYRHWGPQVLNLDYTRKRPSDGTQQRVVKTLVCPADNDP